MMHCGFHGFFWVIGAIFAAKLLFRGYHRNRFYGRFAGGCGPRHFGHGHHHDQHGGWGGGGWGGGHWHDGPPQGGWQGPEARGDWQGPYRGGPDQEGPWQGQEEGRGWGRGRGGPWGFRKLGWIFQGLQTTPEQERVLHETFGELRGAGSKIAGKVAASRSQWADALEAESFDETLVGGAVAELEHAVEEGRKTAIDAFAKIHATLDAEQRKRLAGFLRKRRGPFGR